LVAFSNPFIVNGATKLSTKWFPDDQRALATSLGSLAGPFGSIIGLALGPFYIYDDDIDNPELGKEHNLSYMIFMGIICTIISLPCLILYREQPLTYPSAIAEKTDLDAKSGDKSYSQMADLRILGKNKNYYLLSVSFMMLYGVYSSLGAIINLLVTPYDYTGTDASIFGGAFIVTGIIGGVVFSYFLDKYGAYLISLKVICVGSLLLSAVVYWTLPSKIKWLFILNISFLGFFLLAIIPVGLSYAVELTRPVSEIMSNGIVMTLSQVVGSVAAVWATILTEDEPKDAVILFSAMILIGTITALLMTPQKSVTESQIN